MPQSLAKVYIHLVFSTKRRIPCLVESEQRARLYAVQGNVLKRDKAVPIRINGTADHVHILFQLPRDVTIARIVGDVKKESTKWLKSDSSALRGFEWQVGYGAFSVSHSAVPDVIRYIENQEHHHHAWRFEDEFRELCRRHELPLDERYAWD